MASALKTYPSLESGPGRFIQLGYTDSALCASAPNTGYTSYLNMQLSYFIPMDVCTGYAMYSDLTCASTGLSSRYIHFYFSFLLYIYI